MELYHRVTLPGQSILVVLEPLPIDNLVPEEEEVDREVQILKLNRLGGPYNMRAEHIWPVLGQPLRRNCRTPLNGIWSPS